MKIQLFLEAAATDKPQNEDYHIFEGHAKYENQKLPRSSGYQ